MKWWENRGDCLLRGLVAGDLYSKARRGCGRQILKWPSRLHPGRVHTLYGAPRASQLNARDPHKLIHWSPNPQYDAIGSWDLWEVIRLRQDQEAGVLMTDQCPCLKPSFSPHRGGHREKAAISPPRTQLASTGLRGVPASRTLRRKHLLPRPPTQQYLLQQPGQTKTQVG